MKNGAKIWKKTGKMGKIARLQLADNKVIRGILFFLASSSLGGWGRSGPLTPAGSSPWEGEQLGRGRGWEGEQPGEEKKNGRRM